MTNVLLVLLQRSLSAAEARQAVYVAIGLDLHIFDPGNPEKFEVLWNVLLSTLNERHDKPPLPSNAPIGTTA